MTRRVGIRQLRAQASIYIRQAGAGEEIVVTVSGEPIAVLGPLEAPTSSGLTISDLIIRGAVIAPRRTGDLTLSDAVNVHSGARIDQLLRQVRG